MITHKYHRRLRIHDFTAFPSADCTFVPGINVFAGENGSGKTHLMKVLYSIQLASHRQQVIEPFLQGVFQTEQLTELVASSAQHGTALVYGEWGDDVWQFQITKGTRTHVISEDAIRPEMTRPIFIPAIDMLGHTRRFVSTYNEYQIDFDQTQRDIVSLLLSPEKRTPSRNGNLLQILSLTLGGGVHEEGERFYFDTPHGSLAAPLVAEGIRKIATLYLLIRNGWLEPGSVLFWDEPEVNVNPILMRDVVKVLIELATSGVQIFLATHSYVVLKELDLQAAPQSVRYFALDRGGEAVTVSAYDDYSMVEPNRIADAFDSLYDRVLTKSTGRPRTNATSR